MLRDDGLLGPDRVFREAHADEISIIPIDAVADVSGEESVLAVRLDRDHHGRPERDGVLHLHAASDFGDILQKSLLCHELVFSREPFYAHQIGAQVAAFIAPFCHALISADGAKEFIGEISIEEVAHFFSFGFEIAAAGLVVSGDAGDAFGDGDARGFEGSNFVRVVREKAHGADSEMAEDGSGELVVAEVAFEAELFVGFDGVGAQILELVGAEFVHEADAAAFLEFVDDDAASGGSDFGEGDFELSAAVAAEAVENVSGEALGVDAHERRGIGGDIAHDERHGFVDSTGRLALEAIDPEGAVFGGEVGLGDLAELKVFGWNNFIIMNRQGRDRGSAPGCPEEASRRVSTRHAGVRAPRTGK